MSSTKRLWRLVSAFGLILVGLSAVSVLRSGAATQLLGDGSSFAAPEVQVWQHDTALPPYSLNVNFNSNSSGQGRFDFSNRTVDFAVSDIRYQPYPLDTKSPGFPFIYVPVTAGGLAFMYHLNGLSSTLQLSSYSACAVFTGGVPYWDNPIIKADNPGVSLPHVAVHPVTRDDLAGTNFVLEEYCIHEQPNTWKSFINAVAKLQGQLGDLSATEPRSDWPHFPSSINVQGSATAADTVAANSSDGYITAVETSYAIQRHSPVASVKNASGVYTQPTGIDVASALAYATQQPDGTHTLNFDGIGPHVYNPSTYSYLLAPTTGFNPQKGHDLAAFAYYALTIGQQRAAENGYASLGLSLEQLGVQRMKSDVPGAGNLTSSEQTAFASGDLTQADVAAGRTTPSAPAGNGSGSGSGAGGGGGSTAANSSGGTGGGTGSSASGSGITASSGGTRTGGSGAGSRLASSAGAGTTGAGSGLGSTSSGSGTATGSSSLGGDTSSAGGSTGTGSGTGSVDPNVSLGGGAPSNLATTAGYQGPLGVLGGIVVLVGEFGRRRLTARLK